MAEKVSNLGDGVAAAKQIINEGSALKKLISWVKTQNRNPESGSSIISSLCHKGNIGIVTA